MGVYLAGVYLMGLHLMGLHVMGLHLIGVCTCGRTPHRRILYGRVYDFPNLKRGWENPSDLLPYKR
jgi:hypothetical protein